MSPEKWQDSHAVDRRTDLWAVGVILFELLTGERPFRAERDQKLLMQQILNADPPPPSQLNSQVPADLDTLCLKCLEKDPSRRFPTAAALAQELHRFLHGEPIHSRPITQWERARKWCQRNPAVASLSATVVLVLLTNTVASSYLEYNTNLRRCLPSAFYSNYDCFSRLEKTAQSAASTTASTSLFNVAQQETVSLVFVT